MSAAAFREIPRPQDAAAVREMVAATGFFSDEEADIAKELVDERLAKGEDSGYFFVFADSADGGLDGYACYRITSYNVCYTKLLRKGRRAHEPVLSACPARSPWKKRRAFTPREGIL